MRRIAGLGKGAPLGTGRFDANLQTAMTNFVGALAQAEAALGLRIELLNKPVKVSTIFPGYIGTEMNEHVANTPLIVDTVPGVRAIVAAIEAEKATAYVPSWPWSPIARVMRFAPLPLLKRMI